MNMRKWRIIMNSFFNSQFIYCLLIWMFHNRSVSNKINRLHERHLHIAYSDFKSSFENLFKKDGTVSTYVKDLQILVTETLKIPKSLSVPAMSELFHQSLQPAKST